MPNFVYEQYRSPYISTIGELLLHQNDARAHAAEITAQAQARAAEQRGQIVAGVIQTAGQIPLQMQQGRQQAVADEANRLKLTEMKSAIAERDAFKQTLRDTPMLTENGLQIYDLPTLTQKSAARGIDPAVYIKPLSELNDAFRQFNASRQAVVVEGAKKVAAAGNDPEFANAFLDTIAGNHVYPPEQIQQFRDLIKVGGQPAVARLTSYLMGPQKMENAAPGSMARNPTTGELVPGSQVPPTPGTGQHVINGQLVGPDGQPIGAPIPAQHPPQPKSLQKSSVLLDGKPAEVLLDPTPGGKVYDLNNAPIENAASRIKPIPPASTQVNVGQQNDAKSIADAIIRGEQPPDVKGLYRLSGPVRAELAAQGYDMMKANLDWEATKKHLSTLNGAQQTRLRQAISTASDSLGVIEDLAQKWDGGKFPLLNKANLALATNGALGPQAQQIATNLQAQITDVVSELGNVYMGGNSPTDHALSLAGKNLSADWTRDQLLSAIKLARTNLQIRNNSILNSGAILSTPQPQAPPAAQTAAPAMIEAKDPQGNIHHAPAGTPLPAGWVLVKR